MNRPIDRRRFLAACASAGVGSAALAALPSWVRSALAAQKKSAATPGAAVATGPNLIVRNEWPEHWETTLQALGRDPITPNDVFFVRSHFVAPEVDDSEWRLEVTGLVETPLTLGLDEVKAMRTTQATCTLECAGNGRGLYALPSTSGTQWGYGAVGTARWGGVPMTEVLKRAGVSPKAKHVWLEAADQSPIFEVPKFLRSIPIEKAMGDTLLAHTMNGEPLPKLHGFPLRAIVPGWFGMASTKWVTRIRLDEKPSDNHFMAKGYRWVYPGEDPAAAKPVEEMRVKSLITRPLEGERVAPGKLQARGFAWAGPAGVRSVEVSTDDGATWRAARLEAAAQPNAWRAWAADMEPRVGGALTILARATDGAGETQPPGARPNGSGYGNNSIHKVAVHVGP